VGRKERGLYLIDSVQRHDGRGAAECGRILNFVRRVFHCSDAVNLAPAFMLHADGFAG